MPHSSFADDDRGQTLPDYLMGVSIFLFVVLASVFLVHSSFVPLDDTAPDASPADRALETAVEKTSSPPMQTTLDEACTVAVFDVTQDGTADTPIPDHCSLTSSTTLTQFVGIDSQHHVNMTVEKTGTVASVRGVTLATGPETPDGGGVVTAFSYVSIDGTTYQLHLRGW